MHEEGYRVERQPDGELEFRRPDGRVLLHVPPRPRVPEQPVDALRAANDAHGLVLDAQTATPGWLGEPLNVAYAIDVLHPLAIATRAPAPTLSREIELSPVRFSDPWRALATD